MNSFYRGILTGVVLSAAVLVVVAFQGTTKIGSIDLDKVVRDSKTGKAAETTFKTETQLRNDLLQFLDSNRLYDDQQRKEIKDLWLTSPRTPEQEKRLVLLRDQGPILQKEFTDLQQLPQTPPPSAAQKQRLDLLTGRFTEMSRNYLPRLQQELQDDLEAKRQKSLSEIVKRVKATVQQMGQAQGFTVIYDGQYAPYAQFDISDAVMKEIDK